MATKNHPTVSKISVQLWKPLVEKFEKKMEMACLRRDAYLNKVLEVELDFLDQEVSIPNSQVSFKYVTKCLKRLDRTPVSLALSPQLIERLNEICSRKRIVRDAFFNRIFLLLAAQPKLVDKLLCLDSEWRAQVWSEYKHEGPFFQNGFYPLEPSIDPFWAIRTGFEIYTKDEKLEDYIEPSTNQKIQVKRGLLGAIEPADNLYTIIFSQKVGDNNLFGLSCYMPDYQVPGTEVEKKYRMELDEIFAELTQS